MSQVKEPVTILEARAVTHFYASGLVRSRRAVPALNSVNLQVYEGETLGLVGESGSGKTTLARILVGLIRPSQGMVLLNGQAILRRTTRREKRLRRRLCQIVFQNPHSSLNPYLNIETSMSEALASAGVPRSARESEAVRLLASVGLDKDVLSRRPAAFSGGQKQRIVLARALAVSPRVLILDEPTASLDLSVQAGILNLLLDLRRQYGLTYVLISHDLHVVGYMSDRIGVLRRGRLIECAEAERFLAGPERPYSRELLGL